MLPSDACSGKTGVNWCNAKCEMGVVNSTGTGDILTPAGQDKTHLVIRNLGPMPWD